MKRLIQVIAVVIAGLLFVPPAVAEGLCFMLHPTGQASMPACCAEMQTPPQMGSGTPMALTLAAHTCDTGCCSVSGSIPASQTARDKFEPVSKLVALIGRVAAPAALTPHGVVRESASGDTPTPRHILLRSLRI